MGAQPDVHGALIQHERQRQMLVLRREVENLVRLELGLLEELGKLGRLRRRTRVVQTLLIDFFVVDYARKLIRQVRRQVVAGQGGPELRLQPLELLLDLDALERKRVRAPLSLFVGGEITQQKA